MNFSPPGKSNEDSSFRLYSDGPGDSELSLLLEISDSDISFLDSDVTHGKEGEKYLVFQIDEKLYGVSSQNVSEVANPIPVTPLPNVPSWLTGISNLRGDIIPIVSLREFWKKKESNPEKPKLIIFRSEENDSTVAFEVDKLHEMVTLTEKDINFSAADFVDSFPTFFGKADFNSQTIYLLDAENLLNSIKLDQKPI